MEAQMKRCPRSFISLALAGACALAALVFAPSASSADITGCCFAGVCGNKTEKSCRASGGTPLNSTCTSADDPRCAKVCCLCSGAAPMCAIAEQCREDDCRVSGSCVDGNCPPPRPTPTPRPCGFTNGGDDDDDAEDGPQCGGACLNAGERCLLLESTSGTRECRCARPCGLDPSTNMGGGVCPDPRTLCLADDDDHECHCR